MEIFSPNPSKNIRAKSLEQDCSLLLVPAPVPQGGCTRGHPRPSPTAAPKLTPPTALLPSPHQLSCISEISFFPEESLGHSRLQRLKAGLMFSQDQRGAAAQHKPHSGQASASGRHRKNPRMGWAGSYSSSLLPQTRTPSTIPGIPVQLKPEHFQGWSIPKAYLGVQSFFSFTTIVIPAYKQNTSMKKLCSCENLE